MGIVVHQGSQEKANTVFQVDGFHHFLKLNGKEFFTRELANLKAKLELILKKKTEYPRNTTELRGVRESIDREMEKLSAVQTPSVSHVNAVTPADGSVDDKQTPTAPIDASIRLYVINGKLKWRTERLLMFLDRHDVLYVPANFFFRCTKFKHWGAPGPLDTSILWASWSFLKILLFLFFVFIVVMAFGDAYKISSTNQLLATVATGLVPFLFKNVWAHKSTESSVDTHDVLFQKELHEAITDYEQNWPIYDVIKHKVPHHPGGTSCGRNTFASNETKHVKLFFCQKEVGGDVLCTCLRCFSRSVGAGDKNGVEASSEESERMMGIAGEENQPTGAKPSASCWGCSNAGDSMDTTDGCVQSTPFNLDSCEPLDVKGDRKRLKLVALDLDVTTSSS